MAGNSARSEWARRYPPLAGGLLAAILAATVLPSSLNVPQTNPQQTLEFAPVPPSDEDAPPPPGGGDLGSLALGTSAGPETGYGSGSGDGPEPIGPGELPPGAPPPPPGPPPGAGSRPSTKACVGNPPRQTEDPLSPPCVAFFEGDNGGATYQGVTRDEVTLLFVWDAGQYGPTSRGMEDTPPAGTYVDLFKPPDGEEVIFLRYLRLWQRYFNERYQTYGRRVHFWAYFADSAGTPEVRRAAAADNVAKLDPFAVVPRMAFSRKPYADAMAERGVMNFGGYLLRDAASFQTHPGLAWAFHPTVEERARTLATFVCTNVAPYPVGFSGNVGENGQPRKYGLAYYDDPNRPEYGVYAIEVEEGLKAACGITFGANRLEITPRDDEVQRVTAQIAELKQRGVTTLVNVSGGFTNLALHTATSQQYYPEWIFGGDVRIDGTGIAQQFEQNQMKNSWLVTAQPLAKRGGVPESCADAVRAIDPSVERSFLDIGQYCNVYEDLRQLFSAIQVAGPRLGPASVEKGFRAIPPHKTGTPQVPACYYRPGDFTCVKDAMAEWWDPKGGDGDPTAGCWRAIRGGSRFRAGEWPKGDLLAHKDPGSDPCNTWLFATP